MAGQRYTLFSSVQIQGDVRQNANLNWGCQLRGSSAGGAGSEATLPETQRHLSEQQSNDGKENREKKTQADARGRETRAATTKYQRPTHSTPSRASRRQAPGFTATPGAGAQTHIMCRSRQPQSPRRSTRSAPLPPGDSCIS